DRLRFDFTNLKAVSKREFDLIEHEVNEWIISNIEMHTDCLDYNAAIKKGATALFNEKYEDVVRMVGIGNISLELCGGTHVKSTGDIGIFKIISEGGIAAGVRRIEALTGRHAFKYIKSMEQKLNDLSSVHKCSVEDVVDKTKRLYAINKELEKKIDTLEGAVAKDDIQNLADSAKEINGVKVLCAEIENKEVKYLREYLDMFKDKLGNAIIVLASEHDGKVAMIAGVTKNLTDKYNAGNILKNVLTKYGGRGGGKPDMAQGGGIKKEDIKEALEHVFSLI
ncbi:DHHA1 domain-containing protein, partial [Thermodesulfobacteriota bacterium]